MCTWTTIFLVHVPHTQKKNKKKDPNVTKNKHENKQELHNNHLLYCVLKQIFATGGQVNRQALHSAYTNKLNTHKHVAGNCVYSYGHVICSVMSFSYVNFRFSKDEIILQVKVLK